ncbi:hypothetical protein MYU51_005795 [Penicillium brevicompactum]
MANTMAVGSPKRLGGPAPPRLAGLATLTAPERDPRRPPRTAPTSPVTASALSAPSPVVSAPAPKGGTISRPSEAPTTPNRGDAPSISELVKSAVRLSKSEDERVRLEKEIATLTKGLQRATQFQQFSSTVTTYQHQLERAKDELARHMKVIAHQGAIFDQSEAHYNGALSKSQPHPDVEQLRQRVDELESQQAKMKSSAGVPSGATAEEVQESRAAISRMESDLQLLQQKSDITPEVMDLMRKIAASVDSCATEERTMGSQLPELERQLHAAVNSNQEQYTLCQKGIENAEDSIKVAHEEHERRINELKNSLATFENQSRDAVSDASRKVSSLSTNSQALVNNNANDIASVNYEAQKHQNSQQIAAQEQHLESLVLKLREQNGRTVTTTPQVASDPELAGKYDKLTEMSLKHEKMLGDIVQIHSDFQKKYLHTLEEVVSKVDTQKSEHNNLNGKFGSMHRMLHGLRDNMNENMATKNEYEGMRDQIHNQLHTSVIQEIERKIEPLSQLPARVQKCENTMEHLGGASKRLDGLVNTNIIALRSLESRYTNLTTGYLVNQMAQEMQKMYPSVGQLNERLSSRETELGNVKEKTVQFEGRLKAMQKILDAVKADSEKRGSQEKTQPETQNPQEKRLSADQLNALIASEIGPLKSNVAQYSDRLQTMLENEIGPLKSNVAQHSDQLRAMLEDEIEPLKSNIGQHGDQLRAMLQESSDVTNMVATQNSCIEQLSESLDELKGKHEDLKNQDVDSLGPTFEDAMKEIAAVDSRADKIQTEMDELNRSDTARVLWNGKCERRLQVLEGFTASVESTDTKVREDLPKMQKQLEDLGVDMGSMFAKLTSFDEQLQRLQQTDLMNGFNRRLRSVEDKVADLESDDPIDQRVGSRSKQPLTSGLKVRGAAVAPTSAPSPPHLGSHTISPKKPKAPPISQDKTSSAPSGSSAKQPTQRNSLASRIPVGNIPSPRPVQDLKKRRRESTGPESGTSKPSSPVVIGSSPDPSSPARSVADSSSSARKDDNTEEEDKESQEKERLRAEAEKRQRKEERRQAKKASRNSLGATGSAIKKRKVG